MRVKRKLRTIEYMTLKEFKEQKKKTKDYKGCRLSLIDDFVMIERCRYE